MKRELFIGIALVLCSSVINRQPSGRVMAHEFPGHRLQAAFLANVANFIEWPVRSFPDGLAPVMVGIVGDDPFGRDIDETFKDKLLQGHRMIVKRVDWRDDLAHLHILFISPSETLRLPDILRGLESSSVLTVSEVTGFCRAGGIIAMVADTDRIRFEVNVDIAQRRGLKISSKLLSLATNVHTKGN